MHKCSLVVDVLEHVANEEDVLSFAGVDSPSVCRREDVERLELPAFAAGCGWKNSKILRFGGECLCGVVGTDEHICTLWDKHDDAVVCRVGVILGAELATPFPSQIVSSLMRSPGYLNSDR